MLPALGAVHPIKESSLIAFGSGVQQYFAQAESRWQAIIDNHSIEDIVTLTPQVREKAGIILPTGQSPMERELQQKISSDPNCLAAVVPCPDSDKSWLFRGPRQIQNRLECFYVYAHELLHACQNMFPVLRPAYSEETQVAQEVNDKIKTEHYYPALRKAIKDLQQKKIFMDTTEKWEILTRTICAGIFNSANKSLQGLSGNVLKNLKLTALSEIQAYSLVKKLNESSPEMKDDQSLFDSVIGVEYNKALASAIQQEPS